MKKYLLLKIQTFKVDFLEMHYERHFFFLPWDLQLLLYYRSFEIVKWSKLIKDKTSKALLKHGNIVKIKHMLNNLIRTILTSFSKSNQISNETLNDHHGTWERKSKQSTLWIRRCIIKWSYAFIRYRNRDRKESPVPHYRVHNMQRQPGCPMHALLIAITLRRRLNTLLLGRPSLSQDM